MSGVSGAALIAAERRRQVEVEGWTAEHDAEHGWSVLRRAARCYEDKGGNGTSWTPSTWPWDESWWKPKDYLSDLIRAGALYTAASDVCESAAYGDMLQDDVARCAKKIDAALDQAANLLALPTADEAEGDEREALAMLCSAGLSPAGWDSGRAADAVLAAGFRRRDPDAGLREAEVLLAELRDWGAALIAADQHFPAGQHAMVQSSRVGTDIVGYADRIRAALATPPAPERNREAS